MRPFRSLPRGLTPLRERNFALYWFGFISSNTGRWMEQTGAVWVAYELTGSPVALGILGLVRAVPAILISPVAGVVADRVDQRRLLVVIQALAVAASLGLGLLIVSRRLELWHLYVQVGLQSALGAVDAVIRQAMFPRLVPRGQLVEAVTLQSTAARSAGLLGPAVGGLAIASLGESSPFLASAALSLVLIVAVDRMRGVEARVGSLGETFRAQLFEGFRYMLGAPVLSGLLKMEVVFAIFQMNPVIITIVGRQSLEVGPEGLGGLLSAGALGSLIGIAYLLGGGAIWRQGRFVILCTLGYAIALVGFAASRDYMMAFIALVVSGVFESLVSVTRNSVMQLAAPERMRGRVMANLGTVSRGASPLSQTQSGILAAAFGGSWAIVVSGVALAVGTALLALNRPLWTFSRDAAPRPSKPSGAGPPAAGDSVPMGAKSRQDDVSAADGDA